MEMEDIKIETYENLGVNHKIKAGQTKLDTVIEDS